MIKIIKADQPLSVQVHPDDYWAKKLENEPNGKSESWFVLDCKENSEVIIGLTTYDETKIREHINNKTFGSILKRTKVKKGDFYNIEAGLVHGIGGNIKVLEVQQPSDITYRYYDYDRLQDGKLRELHIEKALKTQKLLDYKLKPSLFEPLTYKNALGSQIFSNKSLILGEKSIVVNLENYDTFLAEKGEKVNLNWFAVISF